jgi:SAM-dependent methyltransferase
VAAENYAAFRPSYPPAAVAFIREAASLDERSTVVDLAAGTGLMTCLLLPVARLVAVEPVAEMRAALQLRVPEAEIFEGTAEEMPLPSAVADAVVAAQAFHWFANSTTVREIARVLKPDGALILVWNLRDTRDPLMAGIDALLAPYRSTSPGYVSTSWPEVFEEADSPLRVVSHQTFPFDEPTTLRQLKGRVLSTSYVALLEKGLQSEVVRQLAALVGSKNDDAPVCVKYQTEVFVAHIKNDRGTHEWKT